MINIAEFVAKIIILIATYYITLEYVFTCEIQTWVGSLTLIICFIAITVLYMVFRANKLRPCRSCGNNTYT
jgi:uncharacterized membrane protein